MPVYEFKGYDDDQITWPGGSPTSGDTITFTQKTDHLISISDNDTSLQDGTDDRDDEDPDQIATVYDENGNIETSGQVQPRDRIALSDGTNTYYMRAVFIASSNSTYYIVEDPPPQTGVTYTVTGISNPNSTSYSTYSNEGICFTRGTQILLAGGVTCPVERQQVGQLVQTLDHGAQPIRWIGSHSVDAARMRTNPKLAPIRIPAGRFGPGRPWRHLELSRQHRVLIATGPDHGDEVLGPVVGLERAGFADQLRPVFEVEYVHLLFDRHEVLSANGLPAETLLLGQQALRMIGGGGLDEIAALLPDHPAVCAMDPARRLVTPRQMCDLMRAGAAPPGCSQFAGDAA